MLWGYILFFGMHNPPDDWPRMRQGFAQTLAADEWNRKIGTG